eukprot:694131-Ditylum_brightwellii.AAC.1
MPSGNDSHTSTHDTNEDDISFTFSDGNAGNDLENTISILHQYHSSDHAKVRQLVDAGLSESKIHICLEAFGVARKMTGYTL